MNSKMRYVTIFDLVFGGAILVIVGILDVILIHWLFILGALYGLCALCYGIYFWRNDQKPK